MKSTALTEVHRKLGARMVPFAGYEMPLQYSGVTDEHTSVRQHAGLFDVSHMGEFCIRGAKATDLLHYVTSNDVSKLVPGKVQYSCLPNGKGGIVDDLLVYKIAEDEYYLVVNASNIEKDWNWFSEHNAKFGAEMTNESEHTSLLALQGPKAAEILGKLTNVDVANLAYYTFTNGEVAGIPNVLISATGYTGSGGFELYLPNAKAEILWQALLAAGEPNGLKPCGLGARDALRLEMGFCLYGNDIDDTTSPYEAGLGWITRPQKDMVDAEFLRRQKEEGVTRKLVGFVMREKGIPRQGYLLHDGQGREVGRVTSGSMGITVSEPIGLGYVQAELAGVGSKIYVGIRGKMLRAEVVKLPFYKPQAQ